MQGSLRGAPKRRQPKKPAGKVLKFCYLLEEAESTVEGEPSTFVAIAPDISQESEYFDPVTAEGDTKKEALALLKRRVKATIKQIVEGGGQVPKPKLFKTLQAYKDFKGDADEYYEDVVGFGETMV